MFQINLDKHYLHNKLADNLKIMSNSLLFFRHIAILYYLFNKHTLDLTVLYLYRIVLPIYLMDMSKN